MRNLFAATVLTALLLLPALTFGDQFVGGDGAFYTTSAQTFAPGKLSFALYTRSYAKPVTERDIRNNTAAMAAHFGFTKHIEFGATQILYQDVNYDIIGEETTLAPGYTQIVGKMANYKFAMGENFIFYGGKMSITKQGKTYNLYLEPYYDIGIAGQIDFLASYYMNPFYPKESPSFHLNLGYCNLNDATQLTKSGQAVPFSLAYINSKLKKEYSVEISGRLFLQETPVSEAYSQENFIYLTPGFKYNFFLGLSVGAALDVLLYSGDDNTTNKYSNTMEAGDYPNYAAWRLNLKLDYTPSTAFYEIPTFTEVSKESVNKETMRARRVMTDRKSLFEWVVDEEKGAEYIDLELEKIRAERKRAEAELEQLKKEIEEKSK